MKILFHIIEVSIVNSYIIYEATFNKYSQTNKLTHLEFRKSIARGLVSELREHLNIKQSKDKRMSSLKRKAENILTLQQLTSCSIELIPSDPYRVTNRYTCKNHTSEKMGASARVPQTSYRCKKHGTPLCKVVCFDNHVIEMASK